MSKISDLATVISFLMMICIKVMNTKVVTSLLCGAMQ